MKYRFAPAAAIALLVVDAVLAAPAPRPVVVFAAASLTNALQEIADSYAKESGRKIRLSFAASSQLAKQIENGAEVDIFLSADEDWMDYLERHALLKQGSRLDLLGNRLALVAPADSGIHLKIAPRFALRKALNGERLATGDPDSVPVGRYAKEALTNLGVWKDVADRLVRTENVRSALAFVARGEVPLAIVYDTDAKIDSKVRIVDLFPESSHTPIRYPVALTRTALPDATGFAAFLRSPMAMAAFQRYGFSVLVTTARE